MRRGLGRLLIERMHALASTIYVTAPSLAPRRRLCRAVFRFSRARRRQRPETRAGATTRRERGRATRARARDARARGTRAPFVPHAGFAHVGDISRVRGARPSARASERTPRVLVRARRGGERSAADRYSWRHAARRPDFLESRGKKPSSDQVREVSLELLLQRRRARDEGG